MHVKRVSVGQGKKPRWAFSEKGRGKDSIPLITLVRDRLKLADNAKEAGRILNDGKILVDLRLVKEKNRGVGLMDIVSIPAAKKAYRMLPSRKGVYPREIDSKKEKTKLCKVIGKKKIKGDKIQLALHDGGTVITDKKCDVNDTLVIELPERKIKKVIPLKKGAQVLVYQGRHSGETGSLEEMLEGTTTRKSLSTVNGLQTLTEYIFVIGDKKPEVAV